jgi:hypothetical protein
MLSVQVMVCVLPACQFSPPLGDTTFTFLGGNSRVSSEVFKLDVDSDILFENTLKGYNKISIFIKMYHLFISKNS